MDNSGSRVTFDFIVFGCAFLIRERDVSLQNDGWSLLPCSCFHY